MSVRRKLYVKLEREAVYSSFLIQKARGDKGKQ